MNIMRAGDFVRFTTLSNINNIELPVWQHGILIEYHTWEKVATILYEGNQIRVAARNVQLASRQKEEI